MPLMPTVILQGNAAFGQVIFVFLHFGAAKYKIIDKAAVQMYDERAEITEMLSKRKTE